MSLVKDPRAVLRANRERAEAGDKWAQTKLGMRYLKGDGVMVDEEEARKWLLLAAEQGSTPATRTLEELDLRAPTQPGSSLEQEMQRGLQLSFRGEHELAAEVFFTCSEMAPADPAPCYNAACSYAIVGSVDWACKYLREAIDRGMEHSELIQDPDRDYIFRDNQGRDAELWVKAEERSREHQLQDRERKEEARKAAMAEAAIRAGEQLHAARDYEAEARASATLAEEIDGSYKMKGLGVRSLLFDTIRAYHDADRLLDRALRWGTLDQHKKGSLDRIHNQIGRRFDVLCTKAASMKEGASELERTLDDCDSKAATAAKDELEEQTGDIMGEWDNDWEVAKHKYSLGMTGAIEPVLMSATGSLVDAAAGMMTMGGMSGEALNPTASTIRFNLTMQSIGEADELGDDGGNASGLLNAAGAKALSGMSSSRGLSRASMVRGDGGRSVRIQRKNPDFLLHNPDLLSGILIFY